MSLGPEYRRALAGQRLSADGQTFTMAPQPPYSTAGNIPTAVHRSHIPAGGRPATKEVHMDSSSSKPTPRVDVPTIGRRLWYWQNGCDVNASMTSNNVPGVPPGEPGVQPFDAGVVYVWGARMVNLDVTDHAGRHHARHSVLLVQPDDQPPAPGAQAYATWMPYQIGASKRAREEAHALAAQYEADKAGGA